MRKEAVKKVIELANYEYTEDRAERWIADDTITETSKNGRAVVWLLFPDGNAETAVYADTLEELTKEDIATLY